MSDAKNDKTIQGIFPLELNLSDDRIFLNFWADGVNGSQSVLCQIKHGKIFKFVHSEEELDIDSELDEPQIEDPFEQVEISLQAFLELVMAAIQLQQSNGTK